MSKYFEQDYIFEDVDNKQDPDYNDYQRAWVKSRRRDKNSIGFWAEKFYEHMHFIGHFISEYYNKIETSWPEVNPKRLLEQTYRLEKEWRQVAIAFAADNINGKDTNKVIEDLIDKTYTLQNFIRNIFERIKTPCVPLLITHMLEELKYFDKTIIHNSTNFKDELKFWIQGHEENLDFVTCELPRLAEFKEVKYQEIPQMFKMIIKNRGLKKQFANLRAKLDKLKVLNKAQADELYHEFMAAVNQHNKVVKYLIKNIDKLPLNLENRGLISDILTHELEESYFGQHRIEKLYNLH